MFSHKQLYFSYTFEVIIVSMTVDGCGGDDDEDDEEESTWQSLNARDLPGSTLFAEQILC